MTRFSQTVTVVAGVLTGMALLSAGTTPALAGFAGTGLLIAGVRREWPTGANAGGVLLLAAVVFAGATGLAPQLLIVTTVGAVLAWDSSVNAVGLATQLDTHASTRRAELVHTGSTVVAAAGAGAVVLLTFFAGEGLVSPATVIPVAIGALLVAAGLSPRTPG